MGLFVLLHCSEAFRSRDAKVSDTLIFEKTLKDEGGGRSSYK
jgi:hypothetical protein